MDNHEIWRAVPEYEGIYEVSNLGRVQNYIRQSYEGGAVAVRMIPIALTAGRE